MNRPFPKPQTVIEPFDGVEREDNRMEYNYGAKSSNQKFVDALIKKHLES